MNVEYMCQATSELQGLASRLQSSTATAEQVKAALKDLRETLHTAALFDEDGVLQVAISAGLDFVRSWADRVVVDQPPTPQPAPVEAEQQDPRCCCSDRQEKQEATTEEINSFPETNSTITFAHVAGSKEAKLVLTEVVLAPLVFPAFFTQQRKPWKSVLLYGPPGGGKTLLVEAIAGEAQCKLIKVSASSLLSKWTGESEKQVRAVFQQAKRSAPCIVFFDEVDSLYQTRDTLQEVSATRVLTEFLLCMNEVLASAELVFVLGATNRVHVLDEAVLRRWERRIFVGELDDETRTELVSMRLPQLPPTDVRRISAALRGWSAAQIELLAKEAYMSPVRAWIRDHAWSHENAAPPSQLRDIHVDDVMQAYERIQREQQAAGYHPDPSVHSPSPSM